MNLGVLLDNAIQRFADRPALIDRQRCISFQGVGEQIHRLGTALANLGLGCGDPIASLQFNSLEVIEVDLMAAKFGFCRTLLNARSSSDEHAYMINHCGAKVLVFGETFTEQVQQLRPRLSRIEYYICVGNAPQWALHYDQLLARAKATPPPWEVTEDVRHSVYYTSGTTGAPKGVVLSQRNWLILVRNYLVDVFRHIREDDVLLHAAPLSHASGCMVVPHFVRGAVQRVMPRFDPIATYDQIEEHRVSTTMLAPTMIHMMLDVEGARQRDTRSLHPDVMEAVAIGIPSDRWGETIHAVVVARGGRSFDSDGFLRWCRERLAPGKRPRSMDLVESLPKSAYGKILRREILQRYWEGSGRRI